MNGIDLFRLGRRLIKLGVESLPPSGREALPSSYGLVLTDVFENPDSAISEITARTGFPQSHVSAAVAKLRDRGVLVTTVDANDRRRTLVRRSPEHAAAAERLVAPIEPALSRALGERAERELLDVITALELLARHLTPSTAAGPAPSSSSHTVGC